MRARKDRTDTIVGRGGGVLILARHDVTYQEIPVGVENVCAIKVADLSVYGCYVSPNASVAAKMPMINFLSSLSTRCIVVGDFNCPGINWREMTASSGYDHSLMEAVTLGGLSQLVYVPTHDAGNVLDLVLESEPGVCYEVQTRPDLQFSDHITLAFRVRGNYSRFKKFVDSFDWISTLENRTADEAWNILKDALIFGMKLYIPQRLRHVNNRPPWLSPSLLRAVRKKNRLWKRKMAFPTMENQRKFISHKIKVKNDIRLAKRTFEESLLDLENKKIFFNYVYSGRSSSSPVGPLLDSSGNLVIDESAMANLLNEQFRSVFNSPNDEIVWPTFEQKCELSTVNFFVNDVIEAIAKLKPSATPGPDGIPPRVYLELGLSVARPLVIVYTMCMTSALLQTTVRRISRQIREKREIYNFYIKKIKDAIEV
eukprot:TCALIF_13272-PA protein Name:"Protein of unknown function" AED:0.33 eAED:0.35 QI:0/0/0/0.2/1/1/5/0/426